MIYISTKYLEAAEYMMKKAWRLGLYIVTEQGGEGAYMELLRCFLLTR